MAAMSNKGITTTSPSELPVPGGNQKEAQHLPVRNAVQGSPEWPTQALQS